MFTSDDYNNLEQVINTSWGQSSTVDSSTLSVKMSITSDTTALVRYATVITYHGNLSHQQLETEKDIAVKTINAYIKTVKTAFAKLAGHAINIKLIDVDVDIVDNDISVYSQVRTAYFKCNGIVELS